MWLFVGMSVSANRRPSGHRGEVRRHIPQKRRRSWKRAHIVHTYSNQTPPNKSQGITWFSRLTRLLSLLLPVQQLCEDYNAIRIRSFVFLTTASPRSPETDVDIRCKWGFQNFLNLLSLQQCKWTNEDHKDHKTITFMACFILLHHLLGKVKWNKKQEVKILVQCIFTPIWNSDKLLLVLVQNANKQVCLSRTKFLHCLLISEGSNEEV